MKKSRFTYSQIMDALKRAESGISVPDLCRELGISTATFYKWRAKLKGIAALALVDALHLGGVPELYSLGVLGPAVFLLAVCPIT